MPEVVIFAEDIVKVATQSGSSNASRSGPPGSGGGKALGGRTGHLCKRNPIRLRRRAGPRNCRMKDPALAGGRGKPRGARTDRRSPSVVVPTSIMWCSHLCMVLTGSGMLSCQRVLLYVAFAL